MSIGEKLAELRKQHGYTLQTLHELTGISMSYLSAIEKGQRPTPSFQTIERLAKVFGVPLSYFSSPTDDNLADERFYSTALSLSKLYDKETLDFLVAESSRPYLMLMKELAKQQSDSSEPDLLQAIAQFIREQKHGYPYKNSSST